MQGSWLTDDARHGSPEHAHFASGPNLTRKDSPKLAE
jgi:hypothetical protein